MIMVAFSAGGKMLARSGSCGAL